MLSLTLQIATSTWEKKKTHVKHEFNGGDDSTQIFTQYRFCPSVM